MEPRRFPDHLVKERVWGFVEADHPELTTATATTDWVSESPGVESGRIWGRVVDPSTTASADDVAATISPTVKDLVTEQIEKVKVTVWHQTTNLVGESGSTLSKEQIVGWTGGDKTTPTSGLADEVTKDYRVFGNEVEISFEELHWSYYLLIGGLLPLVETINCVGNDENYIYDFLSDDDDIYVDRGDYDDINHETYIARLCLSCLPGLPGTRSYLPLYLPCQVPAQSSLKFTIPLLFQNPS